MVFRQQAAIYRFGWVCTFQNHCLFQICLFFRRLLRWKSIERYIFSLGCARANENQNDERHWIGIKNHVYASDDDDDVSVVDSAILYHWIFNALLMVMLWNGVAVVFEKKITPANTDYILFWDDDDDYNYDYGMARAFCFISFALFKSIQFENGMMLLYAKANERMNNMEFKRFRCIFCSFEFEIPNSFLLSPVLSSQFDRNKSMV